MKFRGLLAAVAVAGLVAVLVALPVTAGTSTQYDAAYYEGDEVVMVIPSHTSANPNQFESACFDLGPQANWPRPTATMYTMFLPGATQAACADGSLRHNHVISTAPGDSDYTGAWRIIRVTRGPNFDIAKMPYTSEGEVLAGAAAGELVLTDTGASVRSLVVGAPASS